MNRCFAHWSVPIQILSVFFRKFCFAEHKQESTRKTLDFIGQTLLVKGFQNFNFLSTQGGWRRYPGLFQHIICLFHICQVLLNLSICDKFSELRGNSLIVFPTTWCTVTKLFVIATRWAGWLTLQDVSTITSTWKDRARWRLKLQDWAECATDIGLSKKCVFTSNSLTVNSVDRQRSPTQTLD